VLRRALADRPDVVIVNKFGKSESEGGGLRDVIADVVGAGIPLLISVPRRNLDAWRSFAGDAATEIDLDVGMAEQRDVVGHLRGALALPGTPAAASS
jgi:nucleoside-triphosphatase THEP1